MSVIGERLSKVEANLKSTHETCVEIKKLLEKRDDKLDTVERQANKNASDISWIKTISGAAWTVISGWIYLK